MHPTARSHAPPPAAASAARSIPPSTHGGRAHAGGMPGGTALQAAATTVLTPFHHPAPSSHDIPPLPATAASSPVLATSLAPSRRSVLPLASAEIGFAPSSPPPATHPFVPTTAKGATQSGRAAGGPTAGAAGVTEGPGVGSTHAPSQPQPSSLAPSSLVPGTTGRVRLKCVHGDVVKVVLATASTQFHALTEQLKSEFGFPPVLHYADPEGDWVMLDTPADFTTMITLALEGAAATRIPTPASATTAHVSTGSTPTVLIRVSTGLAGGGIGRGGMSSPRQPTSLTPTRPSTVTPPHTTLPAPAPPLPSPTEATQPAARAVHGCTPSTTPAQPLPPPSSSPRLWEGKRRESMVTGGAAGAANTHAARLGPPPPPPALAFRWQRGQVLGRGAFGTVYLGLKDTGEMMAVKQLDTRGITPHELSEVEGEIALLQSLDHDHIVRYYGTQRGEGTLSIFLEYASGGSIRQVLERFGRLEESVVRVYTRHLLLGLEYIHRHHIAHRDLKGGNVLVGADGVVKLADFGASQKVGSTTGEGVGSMARVPTLPSPRPAGDPTAGDSGDCRHVGVGMDHASRSGVAGVAGTPLWMAPEVIRVGSWMTPANVGRIRNPMLPAGSDDLLTLAAVRTFWKKADVWSVGCVVIEMLTSRPPWSECDSHMAAMFRISSTDDLPTIPSHISAAGRDFLVTCLQRDPSKRPDVTRLLMHPFVAPVAHAHHTLPRAIAVATGGRHPSSHAVSTGLDHDSVAVPSGSRPAPGGDGSSGVVVAPGQSQPASAAQPRTDWPGDQGGAHALGQAHAVPPQVDGVSGFHHSLLPPRPATSQGDGDGTRSAGRRSVAAIQERLHMRALLEAGERLRQVERERSADVMAHHLRLASHAAAHGDEDEERGVAPATRHSRSKARSGSPHKRRQRGMGGGGSSGTSSATTTMPRSHASGLAHEAHVLGLLRGMATSDAAGRGSGADSMDAGRWAMGGSGGDALSGMRGHGPTRPRAFTAGVRHTAAVGAGAGVGGSGAHGGEEKFEMSDVEAEFAGLGGGSMESLTPAPPPPDLDGNRAVAGAGGAEAGWHSTVWDTLRPLSVTPPTPHPSDSTRGHYDHTAGEGKTDEDGSEASDGGAGTTDGAEGSDEGPWWPARDQPRQLAHGRGPAPMVTMDHDAASVGSTHLRPASQASARTASGAAWPRSVLPSGFDVDADVEGDVVHGGVAGPPGMPARASRGRPGVVRNGRDHPLPPPPAAATAATTAVTPSSNARERRRGMSGHAAPASSTSIRRHGRGEAPGPMVVAPSPIQLSSASPPGARGDNARLGGRIRRHVSDSAAGGPMMAHGTAGTVASASSSPSPALSMHDILHPPTLNTRPAAAARGAVSTTRQAASVHSAAVAGVGTRAPLASRIPRPAKSASLLHKERVERVGHGDGLGSPVMGGAGAVPAGGGGGGHEPALHRPAPTPMVTSSTDASITALALSMEDAEAVAATALSSPLTSTVLPPSPPHPTRGLSIITSPSPHPVPNTLSTTGNAFASVSSSHAMASVGMRTGAAVPVSSIQAGGRPHSPPDPLLVQSSLRLLRARSAKPTSAALHEGATCTSGDDRHEGGGYHAPVSARGGGDRGVTTDHALPLDVPELSLLHATALRGFRGYGPHSASRVAVSHDRGGKVPAGPHRGAGASGPASHPGLVYPPAHSPISLSPVHKGGDDSQGAPDAARGGIMST